ncbi:MAG: septal ring lytic transglycosylase RlpA family protein [Clostridiales bacterium]|nr:septal ring lytic transglycosylase RlpA family protein [Clostridiales bacterium]
MRRIVTVMIILAAIVLCGSAAITPTYAQPSAAATQSAAPTLDQATARALELEQTIEEYRAESIAIEQRLAVVNIRIIKQQDTLAAAREALESARGVYRDRVIDIYKSQIHNPLSMILNAETMGDLYARIALLTRIVMRDQSVLEAATIAAAAAEFHANYLDDLKAQDLALRQVRAKGLSELTAALEEQRGLIARLTEESRQLLQVRRTANAKTRREWLESSIPLDDPIRKVPGVVEPYTDRVYLVSEHHPRRYRSLGRTELAFCSWYGNEFHGRLSASGQIYNQNDFTAASRTLPFGTRLALTRGERRIVVVITDRGPFIAGRDLDLSRAAAEALGFSGLATVHVEYVEPIEP